MKLSKIGTGFYFTLSGSMEPLWLELPITRIHFDSLFKFEKQMFYCILILPFLLSEETEIYYLKKLWNNWWVFKIKGLHLLEMVYLSKTGKIIFVQNVSKTMNYLIIKDVFFIMKITEIYWGWRSHIKLLHHDLHLNYTDHLN